MITTVPIAAWEQAVIVVLFVVGFCTMLYVLVKLLIQLVTITKGIIGETNSSFQSFLVSRDLQWQSYLKEFRADDRAEQTTREAAFAARNGQVVEALHNLTEHIQSMQTFDSQHHLAMVDALREMKAVQAKGQPKIDKGTQSD